MKIRSREDLGEWSNTRISINDFKNGAESPARIMATAELAEGAGTIAVSGRLQRLLPPEGNLNCEIDAIPLAMFKGLNARLFPRAPDEGLVKASGTVTLSPLEFKGKSEISGIRTGEADAANFLAIDSLVLGDLILGVSPPSLWIKDGTVRGATMRIRQSEGKKSVSRPWRASNGNGRAAVRIDRLRLAESRLAFEDHTPDPPLKLALTVNHGEISNLGKMTALDIQGRARLTAGSQNGSGGPMKMRLTGIRTGSDDDFNLSFELRDMDLAPLSPYLSRLAAFTLREGNGDWQGRVSLHRGGLVADTSISLRDIATVAGPDCRFDLEFTRALLLSPDGRIVIDFPFSASVNRSDFSFYPIVGKKIRSLLLRSSVVPFSFVADVAGSAPDEFIRFAPGDYTLSPEGEKNLNLIATVLTRRPALGIELSGNGPLLEITREKPRQDPHGGREIIDLGRMRALRVMQFLRDRGINDSRLRLKEPEAGLEEEILDRPEDRVDLNLFAIKEFDSDDRGSDQKMPQLSQVQGR